MTKKCTNTRRNLLQFEFPACKGVGDIIELSTADISAFLQLIGKLSLSKKKDLGIIEKLSLSKMCS